MAAVGAGRDVDAIDQGAQLALHVLRNRAALGDRRNQHCHARAIRRDDMRVERNHRGGLLFSDLGAEAVAFGDTLAERLADIGIVPGAVGDRGDEAADRRLRLGEAPAQIAPLALTGAIAAIALEMIFADQERYRLGRQQALLEPG